MTEPLVVAREFMETYAAGDAHGLLASVDGCPSHHPLMLSPYYIPPRRRKQSIICIGRGRARTPSSGGFLGAAHDSPPVGSPSGLESPAARLRGAQRKRHILCRNFGAGRHLRVLGGSVPAITLAFVSRHALELIEVHRSGIGQANHGVRCGGGKGRQASARPARAATERTPSPRQRAPTRLGGCSRSGTTPRRFATA